MTSVLLKIYGNQFTSKANNVRLYSTNFNNLIIDK